MQMSHGSFEERKSELDAEFDRYFKKISWVALAILVFCAIVVLAFLGLVAYAVFKFI
jgi:hypothetical protein